ncbi:hypothetical protein [Cellulomonas dongxiuzhuiae]|uniref:hypothetical protein n=1 Tax=Cellulomonas dongxiuzhuiae TaxID=2819979 RepID=UPI001AAE745E|nr:hypothetical protein [Cellulomonas dongxiuzhuiae]MBO3089075.1 hypothetical protein [Cellulomonas dongxiuzhuiae]
MTPVLRRPALAAAVLASAALVATVPPAAAAPSTASVTVDRVDGLPAGEPTSLQVTGSGFQVVAGGFGGLYVLFGWVDDPAGGTWRPSQGGATGTDLRYAVDEAARDNAGYQVFVAFPGSQTAVEANGGTLGEDGSFSATVTVPGARFAAPDAAGGTSEIDCLQVTCGVLTIGAHGVENATNETFTPVTFATDDAPATPTAEPSATEPAEPAPSPTAEPTVAAAVDDADADGSALPSALAAGAAVLAAAAGAAWWRARRRGSAA